MKNLFIRLRELMPDKLITAFHYGYATGFNQTALNAIDFMWPDFGVSYAPTGFEDSKWARMSIHFTDGRPTDATITSTAKRYSNYGAIMMFNVRETDASAKMNLFAPHVWNKSVVWTETSHSKTYGD